MPTKTTSRLRRRGCRCASDPSQRHPSPRSGRSWVELGTERESLLQLLDKNANLGGQSALAGRTARIDTVRSKAVKRRTTVPSRSSAEKSHAGAWAIPRHSITPIRICSISLVRKTPVGMTRFAFSPEPKVHGCTVPRHGRAHRRVPDHAP